MSARKVEYLLIGGGMASANCARWLRESGAEGSVLLVGRELDAPYERPPCSKGYLQGKETREDVLFRPAEWWEQQQIELLTRTSVSASSSASRGQAFSRSAPRALLPGRSAAGSRGLLSAFWVVGREIPQGR
jgi:3-phenylpropionate/trans-cinnamate dioxygenase ferredoxin reductase subunit